jgi:hypothetical protein
MLHPEPARVNMGTHLRARGAIAVWYSYQGI